MNDYPLYKVSMIDRIDYGSGYFFSFVISLKFRPSGWLKGISVYQYSYN